MTIEEISKNLCEYDERNLNKVQDKECRQRGWQLKKVGKCFCDNCFYGRTELAEELYEYYYDYKQLEKITTNN